MRISDWSSDVCSSDLAAVARAIGEPDADRRRLRDAEGNLESKRGDLERDRMPGKLRLADPAHQEGGAGEQSRFGEDGQSDRGDDPQHLREPAPLDEPPIAEQMRADRQSGV